MSTADLVLGLVAAAAALLLVGGAAALAAGGGVSPSASTAVRAAARNAGAPAPVKKVGMAIFTVCADAVPAIIAAPAAASQTGALLKTAFI